MSTTGTPQADVERSPKAHRLSNGSRASSSGSTSASTAGGSPSPVTDMEEEEEEEEEQEEEEAARTGDQSYPLLDPLPTTHALPRCCLAV